MSILKIKNCVEIQKLIKPFLYDSNIVKNQGDRCTYHQRSNLYALATTILHWLVRKSCPKHYLKEYKAQLKNIRKQ